MPVCVYRLKKLNSQEVLSWLNKKNLNARVRLETGLQQKLQFKFAVSYGQTHAIIHRVKHKVDICVLKRIIS